MTYRIKARQSNGPKMSSKLRLLESELQRCDRELFSLRANFPDDEEEDSLEASNQSEAEDNQSETDEIDISQSFTLGHDFFSGEWNDAFPLMPGSFRVTADEILLFVLALKCFEKHKIEIAFFNRHYVISIQITHPNSRTEQIAIDMQNYYLNDTNVEEGLDYFHAGPSLRLYHGMERMFFSLVEWNMNQIRKCFTNEATKTFSNKTIITFRSFFLISKHQILYKCKDKRNRKQESKFFQISTDYLSFYTIQTKEQPNRKEKGWIETFLLSEPLSEMYVTMTGGEIDKDSLRTQLVELRTKLYGTQ